MTRVFIIFLTLILTSCISSRSGGEVDIEDEVQVFSVNDGGEGPWITVDFKRGDSFYYPLMAIWLEDLSGSYIQTLFVPNSVAKSIFRFGVVKENRWEPGVRRYPQTLPYWAHKRNILASDGLYMPDPEAPISDAYSGATPVTGFSMTTKPDKALSGPVKILLEVNQNWDWNEYWTNDLFPDDPFYKLSCQPALVYEAILDPALTGQKIVMKPIGHSHHSGKTGELFRDISTLTTALEIADSIIVRFGR